VRRSFHLAVAALAVVATACGSSAKPAPRAAGTGAPAQADARGGATASAAAKAPGAQATASAGGTTTGGQPGGAPGTATKPGTNASAAPTASASPDSAVTKDGTVHPSHVATEKELPITAAVTPACVARGGTATLRVTTVPKAAIAYVAIYAGEKSGAAPPWGEGHGGNDKGESNHEGRWVNSWTVSLTAPTGPARVMLVVGAKGKQRSIDVPFSVGEREAGGCGT
jgi:endonuclease YncB( thermonuclease family)